MLKRRFFMPRKAKTSVKKIRRNVKYRFPGIDRSVSKAVYGLESKLALLKRETGAKNGGGEILKIYAGLSAGNKRNLLRVARAFAGK